MLRRYNNKPIVAAMHGQSNCSGNGLISDLATNQKGKTSNTKVWNPNTSVLEDINVGVNNWGTPNTYFSTNGFNQATFLPRLGIEAFLIKKIADYYQRKCQLFKYGWPGSGLQITGQNGTWNPTSTGSTALIQQVITQYNNFKYACGLLDKSPHFLIYIQGEGDVSAVSTYGTALTALITKFRQIYGNANLAIILVSLSTQQVYLNSADIIGIKAQQKSVAQYVWELNGSLTIQTGSTVIANVHYVDQNEPCTDEGGGIIIHYNITGLSNISDKVFNTIKYIMARL